jgi:chloramphenicol 3-O phosphotransferase
VHGGHGPFTEDGFRYDESTVDESGQIVSTISCGPVGERILHGTHRAVASLAHSGNNVIVDEMLLAGAVLADWRAALAGLAVYVVQVRAPIEALVERERKRKRHAGLARGHLTVNDVSPHDVSIDRSTKTPEECSDVIAAAIAAGPPRNVFTR